ncbi:hypothetical protein ACHAW6_003769, partial [Cyclotella cf. meneghiniana]
TLLPITQSHTPACHTHIHPTLSSNSLLSVRRFSDNGYVTIFHDSDEVATIHDRNNITITSKCSTTLQVWQYGKGLWHVQLTKPTSILHDPTLHCVNNVYNLPSTAHRVCLLHAALGSPTKTTLLSVICNGNLTTFPRLMVANVTKHFPKSDET